MTIEDMINAHGTYIYNYALKLTCHPQKAEDIAQETFISAWKNLSKLKEERAIKKWLRSICMNHFLMEYRKPDSKNLSYEDNMEMLEYEGTLLTSEIADPLEEVIVEEAIRELQNGCFYAMVRRLTLNQRITFSLVDMFGLSTKEVSNILELSEGATKGLLYRARMNLDSFFSGHCSILHVNNPCSCKAWIEFNKSRENNQSAMRKLVNTLDYKEKQYKFDRVVREKIYYLYQHMEEKIPTREWYERVMDSVI